MRSRDSASGRRAGTRMADRTDVDFTYSLTDRIAWLRSFPALRGHQE
jgi:hypothetical protein